MKMWNSPGIEDSWFNGTRVTHLLHGIGSHSAQLAPTFTSTFKGTRRSPTDVISSITTRARRCQLARRRFEDQFIVDLQ